MFSIRQLGRVVLFTFLITITTQAQVKPLTLETFTTPLVLNPSTKNRTIEKKEDKRVLITAIEIIGNKTVSKNSIQKLITIKKGDRLNPYKLNRNIKNIKSLGSFKSVKSDVEKKEKSATITFIVEEFPMIDEINFQGLSIVSKNVLLEKLNSKKETPYNLSFTRKDIQLIEDYYHNEGYFQAKVYKVKNPNIESKKLTFYIAEGIIDEIFITGNIKTQDYVIIRELDIKPGDIINEKKLCIWKQPTIK